MFGLTLCLSLGTFNIIIKVLKKLLNINIHLDKKI